MPRAPHRPATTFFTGLCGLVLLLAQGCQARPINLNPQTIHTSTLPEPEQQTLLQRWQLAIDLANEFLGSSFHQTLPRTAKLQLGPNGMRLVTAERSMPIKLLLFDDYRSSSCVCATVDTYKDVVYIYRPWGADPNLPIVACNTFFSNALGTLDPDVNLAQYILRMATILFYEKHAHISTWEWFKCQWLEWLIGSGHHSFSMQRPDAISRELFFFWHGIDPATPSILNILARQSKSDADCKAEIAERSRNSAQWRERFAAYLRERESKTGGQKIGSTGPR